MDTYLQTQIVGGQICHLLYTKRLSSALYNLYLQRARIDKYTLVTDVTSVTDVTEECDRCSRCGKIYYLLYTFLVTF